MRYSEPAADWRDDQSETPKARRQELAACLESALAALRHSGRGARLVCQGGRFVFETDPARLAALRLSARDRVRELAWELHKELTP